MTLMMVVLLPYKQPKVEALKAAALKVSYNIIRSKDISRYAFIIKQ